MRICPVNDLKTGDVLAKTVYLPDNRLLLGAGFRITDKVKQELIDKGFSHVYIREEGTEDVIPEDLIEETIRHEAQLAVEDNVGRIKRIKEFQEETLEKVKVTLEQGGLEDIEITADLKRTVLEVMREITGSDVRFLSTIYPKSDEDFCNHAVNTAILSIMLAKRYRYPKNELYPLGLGAFLHDVGKIIIGQIADRGGEKHAEDYYREHPTFGYLLLRSDKSISPLVLQTVNQHHEQQDGNGFPIGLTGTNSPPVKDSSQQRGGIFRYAEICAVANTYDRLLLSRDGGTGERKTPLDAMKEILMGAGTVYNKNIAGKLAEIVPVYPVGSFLRIDDIPDPSIVGCYGVVAKINEQNLKRPTIIVTTNKYQKKIRPIIIDTAKLSRIEMKLIF